MASKSAQKSMPTRQAAVQAAYVAPSFRSFTTQWSPALISSAEQTADGGSLLAAASLCEALLGDDRVQVCLSESRIKGLLGCDLSFETGSGKGKKRPVKALEIDADFIKICPEDTLSELMRWGILLGIGLAFVSWSIDEATGRLLPSLSVIHPSNLRQDTSNQVWYVRQSDGSEIVADPNSPNWLFYTPFGRVRPWARGIWRGISRYFLAKSYANSDWSRYGEKNGLGVAVVSSDKDAINNEEDRRQLASDLANLGRNTGIALPPGFNLNLLEATANTWQTFQAQISLVDTAIAIAILGQNLTTEVSGGSLAASKTHSRVLDSLLAGDAATLSTTLHDQLLSNWALFNFGSSALAPWPVWDTSAPEDTAAVVKTWVDAGAALSAWQQLGAPVDVQEAARKVGIPLLEGVEIQPPNLPEPSPTDEKVEKGQGKSEKVGRKAKLAALSTLSTIALASSSKGKAGDEAQAYVDRIIDQGVKDGSEALSSDLDAILSLVASADSFESLESSIIKAFRRSPDLDSILEKTLILGRLAGLAAIRNETEDSTEN